MKILVTGFDPFGGETVNPSWEAVKRLPHRMGDREIIKVQLPTVFGKAGRLLTEAIETHRPDRVLCIGQAGGRSSITPERVAINLRDASIPDNAGQNPADEPIDPTGESAYFATLPIKEMVSKLRETGIPSSVSNTAGTYVCNETLYTALKLQKERFPAMNCGFIHVPYTTAQTVGKPADTPAMEMDDIVRGLEILLPII